MLSYLNQLERHILNEKQKLKGWKVVEFGEIAKQISERVNPAPEDSSRYIGLEHLDSGSIRVSRWGTDVVLKGQKLLIVLSTKQKSLRVRSFF